MSVDKKLVDATIAYGNAVADSIVGIGREGPGSMSASREDEIRKAEEAVIEAAKWGKKECFNVADNEEIPAWALEMARGLEILDALTGPQPIPASELKPGQRFRWGNTVSAAQPDRAVYIPNETECRWLTTEGRVLKFTPGARVIPIEED